MQTPLISLQMFVTQRRHVPYSYHKFPVMLKRSKVIYSSSVGESGQSLRGQKYCIKFHSPHTTIWESIQRHRIKHKNVTKILDDSQVMAHANVRSSQYYKQFEKKLFQNSL